MSLSFLDRLSTICDRVEQEEQNGLAGALRDLSEGLAAVLKDGTWADANVSSLDEVIEDANQASVRLDSVACVRRSLLDGALSVEIKINGEFDVTKEQVRAAFASGELPDKPFCYIAWCATPATYFYVGKAGSKKRVNLDGHGKLAHACAGNATRLSFVYPRRVSTGVIDAVESSLIDLLEPEMNKQVPGRQKDSAAWNGLKSLADFLEDVANRIRSKALFVDESLKHD